MGRYAGKTRGRPRRAPAEFRGGTVRFAQASGFRFVKALRVTDKLAGKVDSIAIDSMPAAMRDSCGTSCMSGNRDPVMQDCRPPTLQKLGCASKHQGVLEAMRLGRIR
jgi:hypothetical protein